MMWVYQLLDFLVTVTEAFSMCIPMYCLLKKPRFQKGMSLFIPIICVTAFTYLTTWFTDLGALKIFATILLVFVCTACCFRDSAASVLTVIEVWYTCFMILPEMIIITLLNWYWKGDLLTIVEGIETPRWQIYILTILLRFFLSAVIYGFLKEYRYRIQVKDTIVLTVDFLVVVVFFFLGTYSILNIKADRWIGIDAIASVFGVVFTIHFLYAKNIMYLREQEQKDKLQIAQLQQQYVYYQDKLKDEERVRSIYHDMKNHLLVLEGSQGTESTRQMAQELRSQISDYEDYTHTGNDFLDIILRDKTEKAREKQIDFSVSVDFSDIDFIEPLDISTMFGNGLDNAIEASEKLPEGQRTILLKAGRRQNFVSILIENNCIQDSEQKKEHTTKTDSFLHGFGIDNMKKAVEKYNGTCTTSQKEGKFTLKILLPVPEVRRDQ